MICENAKKIIEENPAAFATVSNNKPNTIGIDCVKVTLEDEILITNNYMKQTKENLNNKKSICFAVWDKDLKGYKLIGTVKYLTFGKLLDYIKNMPENKGLPAKERILIKLSKAVKLK